MLFLKQTSSTAKQWPTGRRQDSCSADGRGGGGHGFVPCGSPDYQRPMSDQASVDWPMNILLLNIKTHSCQGPPPSQEMKASVTNTWQQVSEKVQTDFDDDDTAAEGGIVWKSTSVTSGMQAPSFVGWEVVCGPIGGNMMFKQLPSPTGVCTREISENTRQVMAPSLLQDVTNTIVQALQKVKGNEGIKSKG